MKPGVVSFDGLLESMTKELPYQQLRLNYDFRDRLDAFVLLMEKAKETGDEALLFSIAPKARTLDEVEINAGFRVEFSEETQTELRVRILNLGFLKRYAYSGYSESRVQVLARRIPTEAGKHLKPPS